MAAVGHSEQSAPQDQSSTALRVAATILRTIFIFTLLALTVRVSLPQSETIWSAYETPDDLIRMLLGLLLCIWFVALLFRGPRDARGLRTWLYIGVLAEPFVLICLYAVW